MSDLLLTRLRAILGDRSVLTALADVAPYTTDWRGLFRGHALCVVLPRSADEVSAVLRACVEAGHAVVPQGGNTGLSGGATPDASGRQVVVALTRMAAIRSIDVAGETMEVEAGCILQVAQTAAREQGLLLPVSLAAEGSAQIGGIIATNAGGTNVLRYGMARARVLGLEVVLADGTVVNGLRALRKDNAGYDWKQWFIGTEGTLGIVTAAVLQLAPLPRHTVTAWLALSSAEAAIRVLRAARQELGEALSGFELMSGAAISRVEEHVGLRSPLPVAPWFVLLEASASLGGLREAAEAVLGRALEEGDAADCVLAESEQQAASLWKLRESITEAEARTGKSMKHDVSVPVSAIPAFLAEADRAVTAAFPGVRINAFGHAGDGNIHYNVILTDTTDTAALNRVVHDLAVRYGGSISAEHGLGQYRVDEAVRTRHPAEIALAQRIRAALDPGRVLNPGKVLPA